MNQKAAKRYLRNIMDGRNSTNTMTKAQLLLLSARSTIVDIEN